MLVDFSVLATSRLKLTVYQLQKYLKLDQKGSVMAEYIWIDGSNGVRSKTKVILQLVAAAYSRLSTVAEHRS